MDQENNAVKEAVSLVEYRRQLLEDAKKAHAETRRLVSRCEAALHEARQKLTETVLRSATQSADAS